MNDLINKFPNGQELYNTNTVFYNIVNSIYRGLDLYSAISIFAEQNTKQQEIVKDLIKLMPSAHIILKQN